ncbi:MAG TPA: hypothetical protein VFY84_15340 [Jiangellales bacterium]|nr:hypothetical protein [Jiangellales bacterium]
MNARSNVIALPSTRDRAAKPAVDVTGLTFDELRVVFYAAGLTWRTHRKASIEELSAVAVEQVNRLGLNIVQELARQTRQAIDTRRWGVWESLLPGREARSNAGTFAELFLRYTAIATHPPAAALMWNGLSSVSTALRGSARFQSVVGPVLRAGRSALLPRSAPRPRMGGRVKDRRSRSRSDAGGVLDAGTQQRMIERRGGECSVVGPWWWAGWVATTRRGGAGRCAACLMFACRDRKSGMRRMLPLTSSGCHRRGGGP